MRRAVPLIATAVATLLIGAEALAATGVAPGATPGTPTFSATPLAWTHAQFIRLWSISAGHPVEQPSVVACRYVRKCQ